MKLCLVSVVLILIITSYKGMADAMLPAYMCTYPVSHDREAPQWEFFHIDDDFLPDDNATKETCWDYCNKDEKCRSTQLIIHGDGRGYCYRYNIAVQELKDTERYLDIFTQTNRDEYPTYITYDRDCAECTYPVSHAWEWPDDIYFIDDKEDDIPTLKTCQAWCTEDVRCRSVMYLIDGDSRGCYKYSISLQELKDWGRYNEIYKLPIMLLITYDKQCADPPSITCSNTYPVSHEGEALNYDIYGIEEKLDDNFTPKTCQGWCTEDVRCRSVTYVIYDHLRWCHKYSISLKDLKDSGRYNEIINRGIVSYITYDKQCVESLRFKCTNEYPVSHDRESPDLSYINWLIDTNATAKTCQDYCTKDVNCRSVTHQIRNDGRWCYKYNISVQKLKDTGRYNEIYTENDTDHYHTYITYDRDCVEVSPTTKGPGTDGDEVSPATKGPGTNAAAIAEPMIVLIVMIGAGAMFVAPMLPGAEIAF